MQRRRSKTILAAGVAALALAAAPAAAQAAEVSVNGSTLEFKAAAGERNFPQLAVLDANTVIVDETFGISLVGRGPNCGPSRFIEDVQCVVPGGILSATFDLGDGNDQFQVKAGTLGQIRLLGGSGNDTYRAAPGNQPPQRVHFQGSSGTDTADYSGTEGRVALVKDEQDRDGRIDFDRDKIGLDVERLVDSRFSGDVLVGSDDPNVAETFLVNAGRGDFFNGRSGPDAFVMGLEGGGPTTVVGGPGIDSVSYRRRSRPVKVTLSQGTRDDGTIDAEGPGLPEGDDISGVEQAGGGSGDDQLFAGGETGVELDGGPGNDIIGGSSGSDVLIGFIGSDIMSSGASSDMIDAEDGRPDTIDCGSGTDTSPRDAVESSVVGCELATRVGILLLSPKRLALEAGRTGTLAMSWTHPRSWRKLRSVTLRVRSGRTVVGSVRISPRADSVRASGRALRLDDRSVRMKRAGKRVSIRVRMRPSAALTARRLAVDVEAIDVSGRKQREREAGALHVRR
jgi:hypothetical protein